MWSGDGRNWVTLRGGKEPSRVLHFNPRPRGGYIAINNFIKVGGRKPTGAPVLTGVAICGV